MLQVLDGTFVMDGNYGIPFLPEDAKRALVKHCWTLEPNISPTMKKAKIITMHIGVAQSKSGLPSTDGIVCVCKG